jgi:tetratricopeptide (TPR) repeat protein
MSLDEAAAANSKGHQLLDQGQPNKALVYFRTDVDCSRKLKNPRALVQALNSITACLRRLGRYEEALSFAYEQLDCCRSFSAREKDIELVRAYTNLSLVLADHSKELFTRSRANQAVIDTGGDNVDESNDEGGDEEANESLERAYEFGAKSLRLCTELVKSWCTSAPRNTDDDVELLAMDADGNPVSDHHRHSQHSRRRFNRDHAEDLISLLGSLLNLGNTLCELTWNKLAHSLYLCVLCVLASPMGSCGTVSWPPI